MTILVFHPLLNKTIHTYWTRLLTAAFAFAAVALTSKFLGAEGKGVTSLLVTNILFITLLNEMIGGVSLIYLVPRRDGFTLLAPSLFFTLLISLASTTVFYFLRLIPQEYIPHLYGLSVLQSCSNLQLYYLLGREKLKLHNYLFLLKSFLHAAWIAVYFLLLKEATVHVFIIALYVSNSVPLLFGLPRLFSRLRKGGLFTGNFFSATKELAQYGSAAQLANIVQILNYRLCFYFLDYFCGKDCVGVYSVALAICDMVWMMSKSIGSVQLTRIANSDNAGQARELTRRFLRFSYAGAAILMACVLVLPGNFFQMIFGWEFGELKMTLWWMTAGILIFSINIILANYFSGTGRYGVNTLASLTGLVVNIAANLLLIPQLGVYGAGIAATLTYVVITFFSWMRFSRETNLSWRDVIISKDDIRRLAAFSGWMKT